MTMEVKNQIIKEYLMERFVVTQKDYPGIFSYEKYDRAVIMFQDNPNSIEDIKLIINNMIEKEIDSYLKRKEEEKRFATLLKLKQDATKKSEVRSYDQLKKAYGILKEMTDNAGLKLYLAGGMVPYLLLHQNSERLHDDIDTICKLEDISQFRNLLKKTGLYNARMDSLNFAKDGQDYGLEFHINEVPIGIYPFTYSDGILTQYSYNSNNKICKEKILSLDDINDYISTYKSFDGNSYNMQRLEVIKKSKDERASEKDKIDSKKILEYGISQNVYDRLPSTHETKNKPASELKPISDKKKEWIKRREFLMIVSRAQNNQRQQAPEKGYQKVMRPGTNTVNHKVPK